MKMIYKMKNSIKILLLFILIPFLAKSQGILEGGSVHGNFEINSQYYNSDDKLGITDSILNGKVFGMNAFGNINYTNGNFSAGIRYEAYLPPLSGFDIRYEGHGIPFWYTSYKTKDVDITIGHFYEQFGNGLVLRSYQEWMLGSDNSFNGARVIAHPFKGITLKGLIGTQRYYWEPYENNNRGIVKGLDAEFFLNDVLKGLKESKTKIMIGGSFVSNYEKTRTKTIIQDTIKYEYQLPNNVAAFAGRMNISRGKINFGTEYAYKINNPSAMNNYIYKNGEAFLANLSYSKKGLGIMLSAKRIDNMSYKSKMTELSNALDINYLPPLSKQHKYSLATIYPYATQPNGEMGIQGQIMYTIPKKSKLGGKYGTKIEINYSNVHSLKKEQVSNEIGIDSTGTLGYTSGFFNIGEVNYFEDFNVMMTRKLNKSWKVKLSYINMKYNIEVVEGHVDKEDVHAHIAVADILYKINYTNSLRFVYQQMFTEQDKGDWAAAMLEYNISPKWFFSVMDEYNYGNPEEDMKLHYYSVAFAFVKNVTRVSVSYGRQREGLLCVGGVCRQVPASNGLSLTFSSSF